MTRRDEPNPPTMTDLYGLSRRTREYIAEKGRGAATLEPPPVVTRPSERLPVPRPALSGTTFEHCMRWLRS